MVKMKNKIISMGIFLLFALVLVSSFASAALELTAVSIPTSVEHNRDVTLTFNLKNTGTSNETGLDWTQSTINIATFKQLPTLTTLNAGETQSLSAVINVPKSASGTINLVIKAESNSGESAALPKTVQIASSPTITMTKKQELTSTQNGIIEIKNDGNTPLNLDLSETTSIGAILSTTSLSLAAGSNNTVTISLPQVTDLKFGNNPVTIKARDNSQNKESTLSFSLSKGFCNNGTIGGLRITGVSIDNNGEGDDNEWKFLDEIEIEVDVENTGSVDLNDIFVELGLFDSNGGNQISDLDFEDVDEEEFDMGDLDGGKDETATYNFRVPADVDAGSYRLAVKAYSDDDGENEQCTDFSSDLSDPLFERIDIDSESDEGKFIAFEDIVLTPTEAQCGDTVTLSTEVFNIGDEDQDQIKITLENRELSIDEFVEIRNDVDQGDSESVSFEFEIPGNVAAKRYDLFLGAQYDFRSGNYRESLDEDKRILFNVLCTGGDTGSGGGASSSTARIDAELETSDPKAGEKLEVRATITNTQSERATFILGASDYQSWASLSDISERIIELNAGQSKQVLFTFDVNEDSEGEQSFTIDVISGNQEESREVSVDLAESSPSTDGRPGFSFENLGNTPYIWIFVAVNIILIILIIIVAVRVSRK